MKVKTNELSEAALDLTVARCERHWTFEPDGLDSYSSDWALAGPIIEREKIELKYLGYYNPPYWGALKFKPSAYERKGAVGSTPLIAAMRCYVASKLGEEVEVPDELLQGESK